MDKKLFLSLALMMMACMVSAQKQTEQILTADPYSYGHPIYATNWGYGMGACIYTASELNIPASKLSGISFLRAQDALSQMEYQEVEIYLGHTSKAAFDNDTDYPGMSQLTKVYDGFFSHPVETGVWAQLNFSTPFSYDGTSNLVVLIVHKDGAPSGAVGYPYYAVNSDTEHSHITANSDNQAITLHNVNSVACSTSIDNERPVIRLSIAPAEKYGITVYGYGPAGGCQINENNYTNVQNSSIAGGTISFDPTTNTLLLNNVILIGSIDASEFSRGDLTIRVVDYCYIDGVIACSGYHNTTIKGGQSDYLGVGRILVNDRDAYNITLFLSDLTIDVNAPKSITIDESFALSGVYDESILLNNVEFSAKAEGCPFSDFKKITLKGCEIVYPVGAVVEDGCIRLNGNHLIDSVHISRISTDLEAVVVRSFVITPSPAIDMVEFRGVDLGGAARVSIYNAAGSLVAGVDVADIRGLRMDVSRLAAGAYTVQIVGGRTRYTSKFIKR